VLETLTARLLYRNSDAFRCIKNAHLMREADRFYKTACFDADFRARMVKALRLAQLPEE
jgi:hypothetical protein